MTCWKAGGGEGGEVSESSLEVDSRKLRTRTRAHTHTHTHTVLLTEAPGFRCLASPAVLAKRARTCSARRPKCPPLLKTGRVSRSSLWVHKSAQKRRTVPAGAAAARLRRLRPLQDAQPLVSLQFAVPKHLARHWQKKWIKMNAWLIHAPTEHQELATRLWLSTFGEKLRKMNQRWSPGCCHDLRRGEIGKKWGFLVFFIAGPVFKNRSLKKKQQQPPPKTVAL